MIKIPGQKAEKSLMIGLNIRDAGIKTSSTNIFLCTFTGKKVKEQVCAGL
jgi:hypothetical protein